MSKEKTKMTYHEHMYQVLNAELEKDETLMFPVYGTLIQTQMTYHGYFAFTEKRLLVALLNGAKFEIAWTLHAPLDLKGWFLKKTWVPGQNLVSIYFNEGSPCNLILPKKVRGIPCQSENLAGFLEHLNGLCKKSG